MDERSYKFKHFKSSDFIWIDFAIYQILNKFPNEFKFYEKVRISSIWNLNVKYQCNIYKDITWYLLEAYLVEIERNY